MRPLLPVIVEVLLLVTMATASQIMRMSPVDVPRSDSDGSARVRMNTVNIEGTEYTIKNLSENNFRCLSAGAVLLDAVEFQPCAEEAFAEAYNAFYMDDEGQCFGSNQQVGDDTGSSNGGRAVYITSAPIAPYITDGTCIVGNTCFLVGDSIGCDRCTDTGFTVADDESFLSDVKQLGRDTCCQQAADGYCLVATCASNVVTPCEARARCLARGYPMASRSFYENINVTEEAKRLFSGYALYFYVNAARGDDGVWRWLDDMSELGDVKFQYPPNEDENGAQMFLPVLGKPVEFWSENVSVRDLPCALCYDPNTSLLPCV